MNTTDYFTYVNAMFLFCIFTCGLLLAVGWRLTRKSDKLKEEQESHLKATKINLLLAKENKAIDDKLAQAEHKLRAAEKEIRELQAKLTESESQANGYKAEFIAVSNELEDTKAKVRKRDKDGKFLPSGNGRVKKDEKKPNSNGLLLSHAFNELSDHAKEASAALDNFSELVSTTTSPKLVHGLTVKNPTKAEAKMIFDEARRLGVTSDRQKHSVMYGELNHIWFHEKFGICYRIDILIDGSIEHVVTAKEFVQRMQNGRG